MKTIRRGTFETNSSSMHTITFDRTDFVGPQEVMQHLYIDAGGNYGWSGPTLNTAVEKLDYATVAFFDYCSRYGIPVDTVEYERECMEKRINRSLNGIVKCFESNNVDVEFSEDLYKIATGSSYNDLTNLYAETSGYIDHQSGPGEEPECRKLAEWFESDPQSLYEFCYNKSYIEIDNDNH